MSQLDGFFTLRTPADLFQKLESDFKRLSSCPATSIEAQYAAFDFFVCAEHMADWVKHANGGSLSQLRSYSDGALASHIASGAKHFRVDTTRHTQVKDTGVDSGTFDSAIFDSNIFHTDNLVIELEDGKAISVLDVASRVLTHWRQIVSTLS
jgi:hypothetical protein